MDEVDEDRSIRLKANIFSYFDKASKTTADTDESATESSVEETGPAPPVLFKVRYMSSDDQDIFLLNILMTTTNRSLGLYGPV